MLLASASNAIIIGFNVRPERKAQELAEQEKVDIRLHSIIYELQDEIKRAMTGLLEPTIKETYQGRAEVLETFRIPKVGTVAGCRVTDGLIKRDSEVRLLRDNVVVFKGKVGSLRRFKDDANEVTQRHGVRHLDRELRRHQSRRRDRGLCHGADRGGSNRVEVSRFRDQTLGREQHSCSPETRNLKLETECPSLFSPSNSTSKRRSRSRTGARLCAA